jgi:transposase
MAGKRRKRFWSDDEKRSICKQTTASGVSFAVVAQRYVLNANLVFKWLRDPRFAPMETASDVINAEPAENAGGILHHVSGEIGLPQMG